MRRCVQPLGALFKVPTRLSPRTTKGDGDHLELLRGEMGLPGVELAAFVGTYELVDIGYRGRPVDALLLGFSH